MFCRDILQHIAHWLHDREKFFLMMTCKKNMSFNFLFNDNHNYLNILMSPFYHNFTNISIDSCISNMGKNSLPKNLRCLRIYEVLEYYYKFNKNTIPYGITHLIFKKNVCQPLNDYIPSSVTHLTFENDYFYIGNTMENFLFNIKYLSIKCFPIDQIFNSLTHLRCDFVKGSNIDVEEYLEKFLPLTVTHLYLADMSGDVAYRIPSFVTHLSIASNLDPKVPFTIPSNIIHLTFGKHFNRSIKEIIIPNSVTHLRFGNYFNRSLKYIPSSVTHLILGKYFSKKMILPNNVEYLRLHENYKGIIPKTIQVGLYKNSVDVADVFEVD